MSRLCVLLTVMPLLAQTPTREEALAAMRKAAAFYVDKVSTEGGYHYAYAEDLSYGRSEHGEGLTQIENQREGTPRVGMAFLEAYAATKEPLYLNAAKRAAQALVRGQLCSGGFDYLVEFDPAKRKQYPYRTDHDCSSAAIPQNPPTTLDDNVTQACLRFLFRVDAALNFADKQIHEAARFGLDSLVKAQYANGAWPQRYSSFPPAGGHAPKKASYPDSWPRKWPGEIYKGYYTFNDNTLIDNMDCLLEAGRIYNEARYTDSALRGAEFILMAQMPEPQPAWAQQYDADMHPAWARLFEPPSITGGESQGIIKMLLVFYRETGKRAYLDAAGPALRWLEKSVLPPVANPSEARRKAREPAIARFFELKTNRPLYITKGTQVRAKGLGSLRPDGYQLSYTDESVIGHYAVITSAAGLPALREEYDTLAKTTSNAGMRRPTLLHGLSPWQTGNRDPLASKPNPERVAALIRALDPRGGWLQDGVIGKADEVVAVTAAHPMVLTINGRPIEIKENDRVQLFDGSQAPRARVLNSERFATNLETLAAFVKP